MSPSSTKNIQVGALAEQERNLNRQHDPEESYIRSNKTKRSIIYTHGD